MQQLKVNVITNPVRKHSLVYQPNRCKQTPAENQTLQNHLNNKKQRRKKEFWLKDENHNVKTSPSNCSEISQNQVCVVMVAQGFRTSQWSLGDVSMSSPLKRAGQSYSPRVVLTSLGRSEPHHVDTSPIVSFMCTISLRPEPVLQRGETKQSIIL